MTGDENINEIKADKENDVLDCDCKICQNCGAECGNEATFCNKCGSKLEIERKCPKCGADFSDEDMFCIKCGENLQEVKNPKSKQAQLLCPNCKTEYAEGDLFCNECGSKLGEKPVVEAPVVIKGVSPKAYTTDHLNTSSSGYKCPYCGSSISSSEQQKCPHCGEWLKVSHFGCGSLLMVLTTIVSIFAAAAGGSIGAISGGALLIIGILYFIPSLIAEMRGNSSKTAIFILNLFLGWSIIGWLIALVMAFSGRSR